MSKSTFSINNVQLTLNHIHSLGVASRDQIGNGQVDNLLRLGLIRQVWIGSYALTEAGERTRKIGREIE